MQITVFKISDDKSQIDLTITDAATITTLDIWTASTYKDYSLAIDLSAKLTAAATENIVITPADLSIAEFDGLYFVEVIDPDEVSIDIEVETAKYKECIMEKAIELGICDDCLKSESTALNNAQTLLQSLLYSVELNFPNEAINTINALDKFCSNACKTCGGFTNTTDNQV
jgi:hypothetical protein